MSESIDKTEKSASLRTGKVGFVLALISIVSLILFIVVEEMCFLIIFIPTFLILCGASLVLCSYGLFTNTDRKLAITGLSINGCAIVLFFFIFIGLTPPGSVPYPLSVYKLKRACPEAAFWHDFDYDHISRIKSQYTIIITKHAAISFLSEPNTYATEKIIHYAEKNGWEYKCILPLCKTDFDKYDSKTLNQNLEAEGLLAEVLFWFYQSPIILKEDCDVLAFDSGSRLGYPAYAFISKDKSKLVIYYQDPILPDPASEFWLPLGYEDLCNLRLEEKREL